MSIPFFTPGNYQNLITYKKSIIIYDLTFDFCSRFLEKGDRTIDQMVQAARSCKQNIVEGSSASCGSSKTEYKLTCVASASLEELLEDYWDYLRTRHKGIWSKTDPRTTAIRNFSKSTEKRYDDYKAFIKGQVNADEAEWLCNICISLIHQTSYLLNKQKEHLLEKFSANGGVSEKMLHSRMEVKNQQKEEILVTLREVYREMSAIGRKDLMNKIETVANSIKENM